MSFSLRSKYQPNSTANTSLYSPEPALPSSSSIGPYSENSHPASPNTVNDVLYQSRLTIKHQELVNRHKLCLTRLCEASREAEALRQENTTLRSVNRELNQHLRLMIQATVQKRVDSDNFATATFPVVNGFGGLRIGDERAVGSAWDEVSSNRDESGGQTQARNLTRPRTRSPLSTTQKVHVCGRKKNGEQLESEVYNRGMLKNEVCNKWRETGGCTYGDQCQFAHGIEELHPVIRHQYGHHCHFRHALTDQERLIGASLKNISGEARDR